MKESHRDLAQSDARKEQREKIFWLLFESSLCWHTGHAEHITRHADTQVTYFHQLKGKQDCYVRGLFFRFFQLTILQVS